MATNQPIQTGTRDDFLPDTCHRRGFLTQSAAVASATGAITAAASGRAAGTNERIRIGFIGPGSRGFGAHVKTLAKLREEGAKIDLVAVSEVFKTQEDKWSASGATLGP